MYYYHFYKNSNIFAINYHQRIQAAGSYPCLFINPNYALEIKNIHKRLLRAFTHHRDDGFIIYSYNYPSTCGRVKTNNS
ncbi:MAG: hypothetical protein KatS3mg027_0775 [Bacteroidia bacterium]|nr:MAG: hypothetical protein KatS3mg027_0775 [Bacteroidia bacterium]